MKGLLLKDFYMARKFCWSFFLLVAAFLMISIVGKENLFFLVYPMIISAIMPVSLIGYDERDKWETYSGTLPYTRGQLVSAKYLVGLCLGLVAFLMSMTAIVVRMQVQSRFSLEELAAVGIALLVMGCLSPALMLPFIFRYGVEKGRIAYFVIIGLACASGGVLAGMGFQMQELPVGMLPLAVVAGAAILLYVLSWRLSIRFYQKREL